MHELCTDMLNPNLQMMANSALFRWIQINFASRELWNLANEPYLHNCLQVYQPHYFCIACMHIVWIRLPGRKNFSISPMEKSPFKYPMSPSHMTPRTRQLYSFGEAAVSFEICISHSVNWYSGSTPVYWDTGLLLRWVAFLKVCYFEGPLGLGLRELVVVLGLGLETGPSE